MRALVMVACFVATATAAPRRGVVESTSSRWANGVILTDIVVRGADGTLSTITEHGGSVDGIGMYVSHRDASARVGDDVELTPRGVHRVRANATGTQSANGVAGIGIQRTSRSGKPLYHTSGCVNFQLDAAGSSKLDGEAAAFEAAFRAWETASASNACGGVSMHADSVQGAPDGYDGVNTIHFRDTTWCRPATPSEAEVCHSPDAVAVTRVIYIDDPFSERDGEIIEVDIEVNVVTFTLTTTGTATAIDLQSAVTHELGHALGLDHNCGVEDGAWPMDRDGDPVPSCESVPTDLANATMYVQVLPGSTTMRAPKPSDLEGLCQSAGGTCVTEVTGGCSTGSGAGWLLMLAFAPVLRSRAAARRR